jgi:hypothetical protein
MLLEYFYVAYKQNVNDRITEFLGWNFYFFKMRNESSREGRGLTEATRKGCGQANVKARVSDSHLPSLSLWHIWWPMHRTVE